jgi:CO/xanthine dehydrogenase Mo-binding subunit
MHLPSGREIELSKMAQMLNDDERVAIHHFRAPTARDTLDIEDDLKLHGLPHTLFSYGAHVACVEVDELTGAVEVKHYLAVHDCGKVINPQIYDQQIQGGIAQGLGFALYEEFEVQDGRILTPDLFTYTIPTAADVPEIVSIPVEIHEPTGPFGLKGVGEIATSGPLPAIANGVADACDIRLFRSPLSAESIRMAIQEQAKAGAAR